MANLHTKKKHYFDFFKISFIFCALLLLIGVIGYKTNFFKKAGFDDMGRSASLIVDFSKSYPFNRNWRYLAQGGESPEESLSTVVREVRRLEPAYVRIDHIYDFYDTVKKTAGGRLEFDWTRLDEEIKAITAMGAKPFLSLSYMPPAISQGSEVDLPVSWSDWQFVVKNTIEHVSGRSGLGIRDVYYEVWNEPDLFGKFTIGGDKNYLELYKYASFGASSALETHPFKFGGPATTSLIKSWTEGVLTSAGNNDLRLDFLSWHRYSQNIGDFEKDIENATSWIIAHPKFAKAELVISEAGINSEIDSAYDGSLSAAHTLNLFSALSGKKAKVFSFEIKDGLGPQKYWGRWGLLTHENFGTPEEKPRYKAILFLNQLKGERAIVTGEGSWVRGFATSDEKNKTYKLLVSNYDKYLTHQENVQISVTGLPVGSFKLTQTDFGGRETVRNAVSSEGKWQGSVYMEPNSATLFVFSDF